MKNLSPIALLLAGLFLSLSTEAATNGNFAGLPVTQATNATNVNGGTVATTSISNSGGYTQTGTAANTFSGLVSASSGQFTGAVAPASGVGVEILDTGVTGRVQSYDRSNSVFTPLDLDASALTLSINSVSVMTVGSSGASISGSLSSTGAITSNSISNSGGYTQNGKLLLSSTAPTIASGFGTTPSIVNSNGTASFAVNVGTGGTASSGVVTLPAATTNWNCAVVNPLSGAGTLTQQSAHTSTSVTLTNYTISTDVAVAWTASYVIELNCVAK